MKGENDMIKKAVFDNFRGFQHMELSDLGAVTLISGKNNSGKSSVLEGIFLALGYKTPESFALINSIRGLSVMISPDALWDTLFHNLELKKEIEITLSIDSLELNLTYSRDDNFTPVTTLSSSPEVLQQFMSSAQKTYNLKFHFSYGEYSEDGHFIMSPQGILRNTEQVVSKTNSLPMVQYIHSSRSITNNFVAELFGIIERTNKKEQLIETLKVIDDSISDITTVVSGNQPQLYAKMRGQWFPLRLAGDGFDRLLLILTSLVVHEHPVLLIDEIETGFHYSVYNKFWEAVMTVAKEQKCQVIATTHSYECLESAVNQAKNTGIGDDFSYFRLGRNKKDETVAYRLSQDLLAHATDNDLEVR